MTNKEQAEKLLSETARAMGLKTADYDGCALMPHPDRDEYVVSFRVLFDNQQAMRPGAVVSFTGAELHDLAPEHLAALVTDRCSNAKARLVRQLKATLARLEGTR